MYIYMDESGNSGTNQFDDAQPHFSSLAVISNKDFDIQSGLEIHKICELLGVSELHANKLGLSKIDSISLELKEIIKRNSIKFHFVVVDKKYIAATKLFDSIFDSHDNPSVPWTAYNIKAFRDFLVVKFLLLLDEESLKMFWNGCMLEKLETKATSNFIALCKMLFIRTESIRDKRAKEIISTALKWAASYPGEMLYYTNSKQIRDMGAANFIAFTMIINRISKQAKERKQKIDAVVHDEQGQFKKIFQHYYDISKTSKTVNFPCYSGIDTLDFRALADSKFEMKDSSSSYALQLTDVVLYMLKKDFEGSKITGNANIFLKYIKRRCVTQKFDFDSLIMCADEQYKAVMSMPRNAEDVARGERFGQLVEENRQKAMSDFLSLHVKNSA